MKKILFILFVLVLQISSASPVAREKVVEVTSQLVESGKIEEAIAYLDKSANMDSSNKAFYHARMGYYYIDLGQMDKAEKYLKQAIAEDGKLGFAYNELGYLYSEQQKTDLSLQNYLKAVQYDPDDGEGYYGAGLAYYNKQVYDKAIEYLEKAIPRYKKEQKYSYMEDAYTIIVQIYEKQGNESKLNETIERAEKDLGNN